jgi:hypothetical protein
MNKEDKLLLLNKELLDAQQEKNRFEKIIDFFSEGAIEDPGFYTPIIGENRDFFLQAMGHKILWLQETIQQIEAE